MIDFTTLAAIALLGAIVGLDNVSFPQSMLNRPVIAATIAGWLMGDATAGLVMGVLLECFALETMPFGASRYPEWGPASVAAGVLAAVPGEGIDGAARVAPFALLAGLVAAMLAGRTLVWLRKMNAATAARRREAIAAGDPDAIIGLQWTGVLLDFGRAGLVTAFFVGVLVPLRDIVLRGSGGSGATAIIVVSGLAAGVGGGAIWKVVHNTKGYVWWLAAGGLIGLAAAGMH